MNIGIIGATGRLGRAIAILALRDPFFQIREALTHPQSPHLDEDLGTFLGIEPLNLSLTASPSFQAALYLDVSTPSALAHNLEQATHHKKPLVVGTTGLSDTDLLLLEKAAQQIPLFYATNFSLGMALLYKLAAEAALRFHTHAEIDLIETHHTEKKDAPSGSSLALAKTVQEAHPLSLSPRIHSIRSGQIVGEHELLFNTAEERLLLSHQAHSRDAFARGALAAARFLIPKPPGLYGMEDLLT